MSRRERADTSARDLLGPNVALSGRAARVAEKPGKRAVRPSTDRADSSTVDRRHLEILHAQFRNGDMTAREKLTRLLLPRLVSYLARRRTDLDDAVIQEAAEDALLAYFRRPSDYAPQRSPLESFLRLAALNNLRDAMRRIRRRLLHEISVGDDLPDRSASDPAVSYRWRDLRAVWRAAHTDTERAFLRARLRGERRVQGLADLLGVSGRPRAEQRAEVNRVWTRLKLRIRRSLGKRERA